MSAIEFLKRQHRDVEQLFEQLKVSDDERERVNLLGKLAENLTLHAALEERHFYPLCQKLGLDEEVRESLEEHREVKRMVSDLLQLKRKDPRLVKLVERLQKSVEDHVEEEETEVFPKVQASAEEDALDQVGDQMASDLEMLRDQELLKLAEEDHPSPP